MLRVVLSPILHGNAEEKGTGGSQGGHRIKCFAEEIRNLSSYKNPDLQKLLPNLLHRNKTASVEKIIF